MENEIQKLLDREVRKLYDDLNRIIRTISTNSPEEREYETPLYYIDTTDTVSKIDLRKYCEIKGETNGIS